MNTYENKLRAIVYTGIALAYLALIALHYA